MQKNWRLPKYPAVRDWKWGLHLNLEEKKSLSACQSLTYCVYVFTAYM